MDPFAAFHQPKLEIWIHNNKIILGFSQTKSLVWIDEPPYINPVSDPGSSGRSLRRSRFLVASSADVDLKDEMEETALMRAAGAGHLDIVKFLVRAGAQVNQPTTDNGSTPLYIASQQGHPEVAALLLEHKATVDQPMQDGATPLYIAAHEGHEPIVRLLAERGADVNAALDRDFRTVLYTAASGGHAQNPNNLILLVVLYSSHANHPTTRE